MKAYSLDLRERLIKAYLNKEGSQRQLAQRFQVSLSTAYSWIKRYRTTGTVAPRPHGGGAKRKLDPQAEATLAQLLKQQADASLEELAEALYSRTGVRVHPSTLWRYSLEMKQTYKKNLSRQ